MAHFCIFYWATGQHVKLLWHHTDVMYLFATPLDERCRGIFMIHSIKVLWLLNRLKNIGSTLFFSPKKTCDTRPERYISWSLIKTGHSGCQDAIRKKEKKGKKSWCMPNFTRSGLKFNGSIMEGWIWVWTFWLKLSRLLHSTVVICFFLDRLRKNVISHNLNHYIRWIEK